MSLQETGQETGQDTAAAKPAVQSLGVWGGAVSVLSSLVLYAAGQGGIDADLTRLIIGLFGPAAALIGGVVAIWGRIQAKTPIQGVLK
jgi:hypothetical protein